MDLDAWIDSRERAALARVRLAGLCLAGALAVAAAWLGFREARLAGLPAQTRESVLREQKANSFMRLRTISLAAYLAKIRKNSLLYDIIGQEHLALETHKGERISALPEDHPSRAISEKAVRSIWEAAYDGGGPPLSPELLRDPWGSPFIIESSERICADMPQWCPEDFIRSAGPDGVPNTPDDIVVPVPRHVYRHLSPK